MTEHRRIGSGRGTGPATPSSATGPAAAGAGTDAPGSRPGLRSPLPSPLPPARAGRGLLYLLLAAVVAAVGAFLVFGAEPPVFHVDAVQVGYRKAVDFSTIDVWSIIRGTPNPYAEVWTPKGRVGTAVRYDTPIGGGLTLELERPVDLSDISEIKVWHKTRVWGMTDSQLDRAERRDRRDRHAEGARFDIQMIGRQDPAGPGRAVGWVLLVVGGAVVAVGGFAFFVRHVI